MIHLVAKLSGEFLDMVIETRPGLILRVVLHIENLHLLRSPHNLKFPVVMPRIQYHNSFLLRFVFFGLQVLGGEL